MAVYILEKEINLTTEDSIALKKVIAKNPWIKNYKINIRILIREENCQDGEGKQKYKYFRNGC